MLDRQMIHVHDLASRDEAEFPRPCVRQRWEYEPFWPCRCCEREFAIGAIIFAARKSEPFTDKQIELARNLRRSGRDRH